jgi:hypothetical protein
MCTSNEESSTSASPDQALVALQSRISFRGPFREDGRQAFEDTFHLRRRVEHRVQVVCVVNGVAVGAPRFTTVHLAPPLVPAATSGAAPLPAGVSAGRKGAAAPGLMRSAALGPAWAVGDRTCTRRDWAPPRVRLRPRRTGAEPHPSDDGRDAAACYIIRTPRRTDAPPFPQRRTDGSPDLSARDR